MAILTNLYPPVLNDVAPAFIRTEPCRIYFSLSEYNSKNDLKFNYEVQVSVTNLKTNISALKVSEYPAGIKICKLFDTNILNQYYIQIDPSDLQSSIFEINQFYKVQVRLVSKYVLNPSQSPGAKWLFENSQYFSEWSNVCLIKGIDQPHIAIEGLGEDGTKSFLNSFNEIAGKLYYLDSSLGETETLKSYNLKIYEKESNDFVLRVPEQLTNPFSPNEFHYIFNYLFEDDIEYRLEFTYTTTNLYTETINYNFKIIKQSYQGLDATLSLTPREQLGCIEVFIDLPRPITTMKEILIRRSSSKDNFLSWETIKIINYEKLPKNSYLWYDTTIESGIWYKYLIQQRTQYGKLNSIIQYQDPIICVFEDIFLTQNDRQLRVRFNPNVTALKYNTTESQQVTLGSQYPFIRKNGNTFYRTFSIGGLISSFMDNTSWDDPYFYNGTFNYHDVEGDETFTNKSELYNTSKKLYDSYNNNFNINEHQDYIYEREFRNKVCEFLYQYNIKLFRSLTQGNILIKLMDVSLEPITTLGRRLYSFSATAIEIDDYTISNLNKYNSINKFNYTIREQDYEGIFTPAQSVFKKIFNFHDLKHQKLLKITNIRITPYKNHQVLYIKDSKTQNYYRIVLREGGDMLLELTEGSLSLLNDILIASKGRLTLSDLDILSLEGDSHFIIIPDAIQQLIQQEGIIVEDIYFGGIHLTETTNPNNIGEYEYYKNSNRFDSLDDITNPSPNHVYQIACLYIDNYDSFIGECLTIDSEYVVDADNTQQNVQIKDDPSKNAALLVDKIYPQSLRYIYYKDPQSETQQYKWFIFNENDDILYPTKSMITYECKLKEGID